MSKPYFNFYSLPNKILKKHKIFVKKIFRNVLINNLFSNIVPLPIMLLERGGGAMWAVLQNSILNVVKYAI